MRQQKLRPFACFALVVFLACFFPAIAWAAFTLTAMPEDGGFDLRFGRMGPEDFKIGKQVAIQVVNDTGDPYRVMHRLIEPLRTQEGVELAPDHFCMYPLINSNTRGSLLTFAEAPVSSFDNVVYTSSASGEADTFSIVYTLTPGARQVPGYYRGRIAYVLVPVSSTASQVVVNMTVTVELTAAGLPVVEITTQTGGSRLVLSSPEGLGAETAGFAAGAQVAVNVRAPLGIRYRLFQTFDSAEPVDDEGKRFDLSLVHVKVEGARSGVAAAEASLDEARGRQLLYTSDVNGAPADLLVRYVPDDDLWLQKAGDYRGRLKFFMEAEGTQGVRREDIAALDIVFEIKRLFDIYVTSGGKEGVQLEFGDVSHKTGPRSAEVTIRTMTNLGQPYHIVQMAASPMTSEEGMKVPEEDFTVRAVPEGPEAAASFFLKDPVPVAQGETIVCTSDTAGRPVEVKLVYELKMKSDSKSGRYATQLGYSMVLK